MEPTGDHPDLFAYAPQDPPPSRQGRWVRAIGIAVASVIGLAAVAGAGVFLLLRGSDEKLLSRIPATAEVVATIYLDPSASQKVNLFRLAERFPALGIGSEIGGRIDGLLDDALASTGLSHEDVLPWLGSQLAIVVDVSSGQLPSGALLADTSDPNGAIRSLRRFIDGPVGSRMAWRDTEYRDATVWIGSPAGAFAVVDDVVIVSTSDGLVHRTIDVIRGDAPSISSSEAFVSAMSELPQDRLAFVYADLAALVSRLPVPAGGLAAVAPGATTPDPAAVGSIAMSLSAEPDGLVVDSLTSYDPADQSPELRAVLSAPAAPNLALEMAPGDPFFVVAQRHIDASLGEALRRGVVLMVQPDGDDLERLIDSLSGDLAIEIGPGSGGVPAGAVLLGVDDEGTAERFLGGLAFDFTPDLVRDRYDGVPFVTLRAGEYPKGVAPAYAVINGMAIIASSPEELRHVLDTASGREPAVTSTPFYREVMGDVPTSESSFFLDVGRSLVAVQQLVPPESRAGFDRSAIVQNLLPIRALAAGTENRQLTQHTRFLLLVG
jgi:uncharacterized protein DUF3352